MRVGGSHLTYCSNIHPGEAWPDHLAELRRAVPAVRGRLAPGCPFGLGLRLSARAAAALEGEEERQQLRALLADHDLYLFTLNGFPYGPFHGTPVKDAVYRPDWRTPERLAYTLRLARLLASLLPPQAEYGGEYGSLSTVPVGYRADLAAAGAVEEAVERLGEAVAGLAALERESGRRIVLALEPEPDCLLERSEEAVDFWHRHLLAPAARERLARRLGCSAERAEALLRRHLGVCLDACHAAVRFEQPEEAVAALERAGIAIAKLQLSAGLRIAAVDEAALARLRDFLDPVYLHQVTARDDRGERHYPDLDAALAAGPQELGAEWRVHFHVPLFHGGDATTRPFLERLLARHRRRPVSAHLEVETYTWGVLPEALRGMALEEAIGRELAWVAGELG